ncbi:MAG: cell wall hydrolase [Clostridia bacterium]
MSDLELLARILRCEAGGEGEDGMRAVATVIMNRVREDTGEYGRFNTLRNVIYAPYQFDCAREYFGTKYNPQNIFNLPAEQEHYDIAQWALDGGVLPIVSNSLWYFNPFSKVCKTNFPNKNGYFAIRIGDHCFYNPTSSYPNT